MRGGDSKVSKGSGIGIVFYSTHQARILDCTSWIQETSNWIPDSLSAEIGFRITIASGIPDGLSWIPVSITQDFGSHKQKFARFRRIRITLNRVACVAVGLFGVFYLLRFKEKRKNTTKNRQLHRLYMVRNVIDWYTVDDQTYRRVTDIPHATVV